MTEPSLPLAAPVEALDLFAGLLSEADAGPTDQFHSRMAAATCRLAAMRRAVIFAYDDERRLVRAVGAHGIDLALFEGASPTAEQVALARTRARRGPRRRGDRGRRAPSCRRSSTTC